MSADDLKDLYDYEYLKSFDNISDESKILLFNSKRLYINS